MCQPSNIFVVALVSRPPSPVARTAVQWSVGALRMWKLAREGGWSPEQGVASGGGSGASLANAIYSATMPARGQLCVGIDNREITKASTN